MKSEQRIALYNVKVPLTSFSPPYLSSLATKRPPCPQIGDCRRSPDRQRRPPTAPSDRYRTLSRNACRVTGKQQRERLRDLKGIHWGMRSEAGLTHTASGMTGILSLVVFLLPSELKSCFKCSRDQRTRDTSCLDSVTVRTPVRQSRGSDHHHENVGNYGLAQISRVSCGVRGLSRSRYR